MKANLVEVTVPMPGNDDALAAGRMLQIARVYKVTSPEMYQAAADDLRALKTRAREIEEKRKSMVQPLDQARRAIQDFFRPAQELYDQAEQLIKRAMIVYDDEQVRIRREEEAKQRRLIEEEQRRLADEAAKAEADRKRLEEEARKAEAAGQHDQAEQLEREAQAKLAETNAARDAAATMPTTIVTATEAPKAEGVSFTETWSAEVVDLMTLIVAVASVDLLKHCNGDPTKLFERVQTAAAQRVPLAAVQAVTTFLNQQARSLKGQLDYPGVKAVATKNVSARRVA